MDFSLRWAPLLPGWLTWMLLIGLFGAMVVAIGILVRRGVARFWVVWLTLLRLVIVAVFALILFQPSLSFSRAEKELPELMILADQSQSMGLPTKSSEISRWQETVSWLNTGPLATALRDRFHLHWHTFAIDLHALEGPLDAQHAPKGSTRLAENLEATFQYQRSLGRQPQRFLLASDGCDHGLTDMLATARRLGIRVDVLPPTSSSFKIAEGIELADVQCARRLLLGSETHFRVTVRRSRAGNENQKVSLQLAENGKKLWERSLTLEAGQGEQTFFLPHRPETSGLKTYDFQLQVPGADKASSLQRTLEVVDQHYEVLILEDTWRWEYKYLQRLFEDDPSFRFTGLLARGGGAFVQFGSPDRRVNLIGFPQNQAELERFDLFFLGDVNPIRWPAGMPAALSRLITEEGKSLVVIAGPHLAQLASLPELEKLLPVELSEASGTPIEGPIEVRQRPEATSSPFFFQLRTGLDQLPPLDRIYPAVRKRPGATILLESARHRNTYGNLVLLAEQTVGRGRVLFVGTDTLWKWHTLAPPGDGPTPYATFWQQAFRALTPQRTQFQGIQLWLVPSRTRVEVGQPVVVEAEVQSGRPLPKAQVQASVTLPNQRRLPLAFSADPADPRRFRAEFASPVLGSHTVQAQLVVEGQNAAEGNFSLQVEETGDETRDVEVNLTALTRLAQGTGGKIVDSERPDTWPEASDQGEHFVQRAQTVDLWNNFSLLLLLTGLLSVDWFLRLFKGLV